MITTFFFSNILIPPIVDDYERVKDMTIKLN